MKFSDVRVFSQPNPPTGFGVGRGVLVIWFETGTENVWLDWWCGDGPWIEWKSDKSIADCLRFPHTGGNE